MQHKQARINQKMSRFDHVHILCLFFGQKLEMSSINCHFSLSALKSTMKLYVNVKFGTSGFWLKAEEAHVFGWFPDLKLWINQSLTMSKERLSFPFSLPLYILTFSFINDATALFAFHLCSSRPREVFASVPLHRYSLHVFVIIWLVIKSCEENKINAHLLSILRFYAP